MKKEKVVYYSDALNDDFAGTSIKPLKIDSSFPFKPAGLLWRIGEWLAYYLVAAPLIAIFCYVGCGFRFKNRRALRKVRNTGYFIYANHTHISDAFLSPLVAFPKKAHVVTSPDAVSIKGLRTLVQMLGAIPLPSGRDGMEEFMAAMRSRVDSGRAIGIFPEAHIWPYCIFVRDFKAGSFRYPALWNKPIVAVCVTYQRRRGILGFINSPRRTAYISDPMYPDSSLPFTEARQKLRDEAHEFLVKTAEAHSDYTYIHYVKADMGDG